MALDWTDCGDTHEARGVAKTLYIIFASQHGYRLELHTQCKDTRLLTLGWSPSLGTAKDRAASDFLTRQEDMREGS